jgi:EAL domain-containing protein (putative c-di-GMP-specific phosphodiesterase class I)
MHNAARLLGFAFANADFLYEIDKNGIVVFAAGATREFAGNDAETMIGSPAENLFAPGEGTKFTTFACSLAEGYRAGPLRLRLTDGRLAAVSLFRAPNNHERISCSMTRPGTHHSFAAAAEAQERSARDSFLAAAASMANEHDALTLLEIPALSAMQKTLPPDEAGRLMAAGGASFLTSGGKAFGQISETGFGAGPDATKGPAHIAQRVRGALAEGGLKEAKVEETKVTLQGRDLKPEQRTLAMRYVVERFAAGNRLAEGDGDIGQAFNRMMDETEEGARKLLDDAARDSFSLVFRSVRDLWAGELSHYDASVRFRPGHVADTAKFNKALGINDAFDVAVAMKLLRQLEADKSHRAALAFSVSGRTIENSASFAMLAGFLSRKHRLAERLLLNITEMDMIGDFETAGKAVQALRALGLRVGLADFGAGAASLNYLHALRLDFVKFGPAVTAKLGVLERDDKAVAGMMKLCAELGIVAIAEGLDNDDITAHAKKLGFMYGCGEAVGAIEAKIPPGTTSATLSLMKRKSVRTK